MNMMLVFVDLGTRHLPTDAHILTSNQQTLSKVTMIGGD